MSDRYQTDEEWLAAYEEAYSRFYRRVPGEPILATIARLSFMVNGRIGIDWQSGRNFTLHEKGDDFTAIRDAVAALQDQRATIAALQAEAERLREALEWIADGYEADAHASRICALVARAALGGSDA